MNKFVLCLLTLMTAHVAVQTPLQAFANPFAAQTKESRNVIVKTGETVKDYFLTAGLLSGIVGCGAFAGKRLIKMGEVETLSSAGHNAFHIAACFLGMNIFHHMMPKKKQTGIIGLVKSKEILAAQIRFLAGVGLLFCGWPKAQRIKAGIKDPAFMMGLLGVGLVAAGITQTYKGVKTFYNTVFEKK